MKILAIDTSAEHGVLAITEDGALLAELSICTRARHGETLLGHLELLLERVNLEISRLDAIAVGLGPGSFTGVRIGLSTAKGLSIANSIPVVGIRSTRVIARGAFGSLRVAIADAHKGEVFAAVYRALADGSLDCVLDETHGRPERIRDLLNAVPRDEAMVLVGSGLPLYRDRLELPNTVEAPPIYDSVRGALLAQEGAERFAKSGPDDLATLEPLYVRASDAVLPKS